ncbi:M60 family metallopeptidase [Anaerohalosphaera lusitana]|nr:M60 family metallopeptidase [Anaerohalosphaera lusitana]
MGRRVMVLVVVWVCTVFAGANSLGAEEAAKDEVAAKAAAKEKVTKKLDEAIAKAKEAAELAEEARKAAGEAVKEADGVLGRRELGRKMRELGEVLDVEKYPTPGEPLRKNRDGLDFSLFQSELWGLSRVEADKVEKHPAADGFPGSVPADAKRVSKTVRVEAGGEGWRPTIGWARNRYDWVSTGLYAAPGELVTVKVGDGAMTEGWRVRIGCHSDRLWGKNTLRRAPSITRAFEIKGTETKAANAFGGLVYIEVPAGAEAGSAYVTIEGAVEAPLFVLGQMSDEDWQAECEKAGPWAELASEKLIVTVPTKIAKQVDNPTALMRTWDDVMDACADLLGVGRERARPERIVMDTQISAGYLHAGYPIMGPLSLAEELVDRDYILGKTGESAWGFFHEIGHNHQYGEWTFGGTIEVTVNLFSLYQIEQVCGEESNKHGGVDPEGRKKKLAKYLADGSKFETWKKDPFLALYMYSQVQEEFGWEAFTDVFAEYRAAGKDELPKDDAAKRDQWMVRLSQRIGRNLGPFFDAWGVPVSADAKAKVADLEEWMPKDWPGKAQAAKAGEAK